MDLSEASSTRCCIVRLQGETIHEFVSKYHGKHWTDEKSQELTSRCLIMKVKLHDSSSSSDDDIRRLSQSDLEVMPELRPPAMMPQGNVGTSTNFFLKAIRECRLPPKVISKLRLEFPVLRRNRKYGSVPFHYEVKTRSYEGAERLPECDDTKMRSGLRHQLLHPCNVEKLNRSGPQLEKVKSDSDADDDDDTCEEWERHESLHNDVAARRVDPTDISQQPGTKERLFEEEMEVVWEKGEKKFETGVCTELSALLGAMRVILPECSSVSNVIIMQVVPASSSTLTRNTGKVGRGILMNRPPMTGMSTCPSTMRKMQETRMP